MNPALMRGCDWTGQDVSGWWASEKFDGWRAYWSGSEFISRQGTIFDAPAWFTALIPSRPMDGELWAGLGTNHNDVGSAVRSGSWHRLTFRPFDIPEPGVTIEAAHAMLQALQLPAHVRPVEYQRVGSTAEALSIMQRIIGAGGEGVMLRRPKSIYLTERRTIALLKMKGET